MNLNPFQENSELNPKIKRERKKGLLALFSKKADATDNMRIITDKDTIDYINATLMAWVKL